MRYFTAKDSLINGWLSQKGYSGSVYDKLNNYLMSQSGLSNGTISDQINTILNSRGFDGSLRDKISRFFSIKMGVTNPRDAERAFWGDSTQDFSITWGDMGSGTWGDWGSSTWGDLNG